MLNGDTNAVNGSDPFCVNICFAIGTLLDFDGDADADIKCEQASWKTSDEMHRIFQIAQLQCVPSAVS